MAAPPNRGLSLSSIPTDFLESYPHAAFVVTQPERDCLSLPPSHGSLVPLKLFWSNVAWKQAAGSRSLLECISPPDAGRLQAWLLECQRDPLELPFMFGETYHLTRTSAPVHWDDGTLLSTHTFAIITTMPCADKVQLPLRPAPARVSSRQTFRPFEPPVRPPGEAPGTVPVDSGVPPAHRTAQSLSYRRDGSLNTQYLRSTIAPEGTDPTSGLPYDVKQLLMTTDWSKSPLGPMELWPPAMLGLVNTTIVNATRAAIWCGREFTMVYNQQFAEEMEHDHPAAFGRSGPAAYAEITNILGPLAEAAISGQSLHLQDRLVLLKDKTDGKTYEGYCTQHWIPCREVTGEFSGLFFSSMETTATVLSERRSDVVRQMSERASIGRTMDDFESGILETLTANPKDAPFAMLYHVQQQTSLPNNGTPTRSGVQTPRPSDAIAKLVQLTYAGGVGVPFRHHSAPDSLILSLKPTHDLETQVTSALQTLDVNGSTLDATPTAIMRRTVSPTTTPPCGTCWPIAEALRTHRTIFVRDCRALIQGYQVRVWDELPSSAVVIPIVHDTDQGVPEAVMILGISSRLRFTEDYENFIHSLRIQMAAYLVAVRSYCKDQELIQQLAQMDRAKNLLFANLANDLLMPISLIIGPLDDLAHYITPETANGNSLSIARRNVRRLRSLVGMLVDVSALEHGPGIATFTRVNFGSLTRDIASMFRKTVEKAGLKFTVDCDLTPHEVYVDREAWEKVVVTLTGQAFKYTRQGFIEIKVRYANGHAVFTFKDSSIGIPQHLMEHAGELVVYGSEQEETPAGPVILFALVKKLVDLHGGTLDAESRTLFNAPDGKTGTTVVICIPLGSAHLPEEDVQHGAEVPTHELRQWEDWEDSSLETPSVVEQRSWGVDLSSLFFEQSDVILVVDNTVDSLRYMRAIFEPFCKVIEARGAKEALELCRASPPNLVICDLVMPYEGGDVVLAGLRNGTREMAMVPFIMLTTHDDTRPENALTADDYLSKPFNARDLLSRGHMQLQLGKRRRDIEDRFEERTSELRIMSENLPMGIFRARPEDGSITYCNAAWHEQSGYPVDGDFTDWFTYVDPADLEPMAKGWFEFLADPDQLEYQFNGRWKNGKSVTSKVAKISKSPGGPVSTLLGCTFDVSEHKINEQLVLERAELAELRRVEAEDAKAQQELLIDITSHEIRNPISSLMQCASLVKTNLLGLQSELDLAVSNGTAFHPTRQLLHTIQEDLEALDNIYECALTQERISNDVLSLGKIQLDLLQMFDVETNIHDEAKKLVSVFQNEARMNRIHISLSFSDAFESLGLSTIKTDPVRFGQVVTNLLANAIRFVVSSDERRIDVRLDIGTVPPVPGTCRRPPEPRLPTAIGVDTPLYLYVEVADTGPGLLPSELETLFQRFTQASAKTHTVFGGSGLGLFVCRKITELMGGGIEVASEYSRGSVFRFFIQARAASIPTPISKPPTPVTARTRNTLRILIVEDNMINRTVLVRQLKHVGFKPDAVTNGLEAVECLRALEPGERYDCVLMDLEMPVMDGYTATRLIREDEAAGRAPNAIIALTGNARQAKLDDQMIDFDEVVVKPYRLDNLLLKIEGVARTVAAAPVAQAEEPVVPLRPPVSPLLRPPSRDGRSYSEPVVMRWSDSGGTSVAETDRGGESENELR